MRVLGLVLMAITAGCFNPTIQAGAPCGTDSACPGDLVCRAGRCEVEPSATDARQGPDAPGDGDVADAPPCVSFSGQFDTCALAPSGPLSLTASTYTYDTDTHLLKLGATTIPVNRATVAGKAGPIEVILDESFVLPAGGALRVTGAVPFGIAAYGPAQIAGDLDGRAAGGQTAASCGTAAGGTVAAHVNGPGGAGGGGLRGTGGSGGVGDANQSPQTGGVAGQSRALPPGPIGGCPGGVGADGEAGTAGARGIGGGAIYVVAAGALDVGGIVNVGGGGGGAGAAKAGSGGGGGSGGMILLESPSVLVTGTLASNGGGGGGGADDTAGVSGVVGQAGQASATAASGGRGGGNSEGGDGGRGGAGVNVNGGVSDSSPDNGGGGGGGGVGYIAIRSPSTSASSAVISPSLTAWP